MIQQSYPSLNGIEPSWADISATFTVGGGLLIPMEAFAAVKWSRKVDVGKRRGASGGRIMSRTTGEGDQESSATLYRSGYRQLLKGLVSAAQAQGFIRGNQVVISIVSFDLIIQHTPPGDFEVYQTNLKGCRFLGDADDMKEGNEPDKIELTLNPIEITNLINGVEVVLL